MPGDTLLCRLPIKNLLQIRAWSKHYHHGKPTFPNYWSPKNRKFLISLNIQIDPSIKSRINHWIWTTMHTMYLFRIWAKQVKVIIIISFLFCSAHTIGCGTTTIALQILSASWKTCLLSTIWRYVIIPAQCMWQISRGCLSNGLKNNCITLGWNITATGKAQVNNYLKTQSIHQTFYGKTLPSKQRTVRYLALAWLTMKIKP